ncbi:major facilitator superfamily domain-containing protein [Rhizoctonia solani]|nr:major facilitator superfamily domain-containing protein [Rhizoctonia solani]
MVETTRRAMVGEENFPLMPTRAKFSWSILAVLTIYTAIVNGTSELVWPFLNQLILDVGIAPDEKSVGFYSGLMVKLISSCLRGSFAADRWGRKVVLCSTLIGAAIGLTFFGVSKTLISLIFFRCIGYALGPQLGWATTVTILGDVSDPGNRGIAFSTVNAAYRVGPIFASTLARPKTRYRWFQSDFWEHHPYALPCWAGAATCIVALYITVCWVPENQTSPSMVDDLKSDEGLEETITGSSHANYQAPNSIPPHIDDETAPARMIPATMEPVIRGLDERPRTELFTPHITQLLISSWIMYFMTMGFFALFPLWAFTPISSGGLGASEVAIGSFISIRAIAQFLVLIPFAYFETRLGVYRLYAYSLAVYTISGAIGFPLLNALAKWDGIASPRFNMAIIAYFILVSVLVTRSFGDTCMIIMINQAAPTPYDLAQLVVLTIETGISQSVLMLGQCMAPITVLSIFELSIKSDLLGGNVVWVFLTGSGKSF